MSRDTPTSHRRRTARETTGRQHATDGARTLSGDERGVSEILGAILVFGLLLTLLVLIQVTAVPSWNQQIEYEHNQRVQQDILSVDGAVEEIAAVGVADSAVVEMGVQYPSRPFLFNPPPAIGTVSTTAEGTVSFENAALAGVSNYDITGEGFDSAAIRYDAGYHAYGNAPVTVYENTLVTNRFSGGELVALGGQQLVDGRTVTLFTVDGALSVGQVAPRALDIVALSAPAEEVGLTSQSAGDTVTVRVPTTLSTAEWNELLSDELDPDGTDPDRYVTSATVESGHLVLELEAGVRYDLRMAKVGVGSGYESEGAHYGTPVDLDTGSLRPSETRQLSLQVRDRLNNPVSGVPVSATVTAGGGNLVVSEDTSDQSGRATFVYQAPGSGTFPQSVTVTATFDGRDADATAGSSGSPGETVTFTVDVREATDETGGDDDGDRVSQINPGSGSGSIILRDACTLSSGQTTELRLTFENEGPEETTDEARVSFYFSSDGSVPNSATFEEATFTEFPSEFRTATLTFAGGSASNPVETRTVMTFTGQSLGGDFFVLSLRIGEDHLNYFVNSGGSCPRN